MKKLMTMIAAVATAFGLYAVGLVDDGFQSGTSFNFASGGVFSGTENDGSYTAPLWEGFANPNENAIGDEQFAIPTVGKPAEFVSASLESNLVVKTTLGNPIYRYFDSEKNTKAMGTIYADMFIRFTMFEDAPTVDENAKIAIWLKENLDANDVPTSTNLWITAGKFNGNQIVQENYDCGNVSQYLKDSDDITQWVRVTIKSFATVYKGGYTVPGFVVFINGFPAACDGEYWTKDDAKTMESAPAGWYAHKNLFLSAKSGSGTDVIQAIGFDGSGNVDNIAFTTTPPSFTADLPMFTVDWDANVATLTVGGEAVPGFTAGQSGSAMFLVDGKPVAVAATYAATFCRGAWTLNATPTTDSSFTFKGNDTLNVVSAKIGMTVKIGDGDPTPVATMAEAVALINATGAAAAELALVNPVTLAEGVEFTNVNGVTLDLAGQTITITAKGEEERIEDFNAITAANLTVTDSAADPDPVGKITTSEDADVDAIIAATVLSIDNGMFDGYITGPEGSVTGGWFAEDPGESSMNLLAEGYVAPLDVEDDWYKVAVATFTVTFDVQGHGTAPADITNVEYGDTIEAPTAPTATGYTFGGWFKEAGCQNEWVFATDTVTDDTTLFAKWTANEYNITYTYKDDKGDDVEVTNTNPAKFTFGVGVPSFDAAKLTYDTEAYDFVAFNPTSIGTGVAEDQPVAVTFTKKQQGWPDEPPTPGKKTAADVLPGLTGPLANVDANTLVTWAKKFSVPFDAGAVAAAQDAFLLDCDPADEQAVLDAKAAFKFTAIVPGTTPDITESGKDPNLYKNGKTVVKGKAALTDKEWGDVTDSTKFYQATLEPIPLVK